MDIVMVSGHACIRCQKEAIPLVENGHDVHMIAKAIPTYHEYYQSFSLATGTNHYLDSIKKYAATADIFHVHNEPSWFVTAIKEACDVPVILDVHDSFLARMTPDEVDKLRSDCKPAHRITVEERNNFQLADGLVFPSEPFAQLIMNEFGLDQPYIILPSYLPRQFYQYAGREWLGGLVYEGRVDLKDQIESDIMLNGFRYCDYLDMAKELHFLGVDFHIYGPQTSGEKFQAAYKDLSFLHGGKSFSKLLPAIGRHDWGLIGNIEHTPEWEVAFPNKLFDYIGACVPIVAINAKHVEEFVENNGIGISINNIEELPRRWSEHRKLRGNLIKQRQKWVMENHIANLEGLYRCLLGI
jgi:hypothetical protein